MNRHYATRLAPSTFVGANLIAKERLPAELGKRGAQCFHKSFIGGPKLSSTGRVFDRSLTACARMSFCLPSLAPSWQRRLPYFSRAPGVRNRNSSCVAYGGPKSWFHAEREATAEVPHRRLRLAAPRSEALPRRSIPSCPKPAPRTACPRPRCCCADTNAARAGPSARPSLRSACRAPPGHRA
jgi:hypothetical protein